MHVIYLQMIICGMQSPERSNMPRLSEDTLVSDLWVSVGCVNGLGLWNISI